MSDEIKVLNIDISKQSKYTVKPADITISEDGIYELSKTANGISRIRFYKNFIGIPDKDIIFEKLKTELPWKKPTNPKLNIEETRYSSWQGEHRYIYWDIEWPPAPFSETTEMLKNRLNKFLNYNLNSVLANFYRDGRDYLQWHSDDEPMLGKQPLIASLNFGSTRIFEMRPKIPENVNEEDYKFVQNIKISLESGSLLIMEGACQEDWEHRVPECNQDCGPRINLTYRIIYQS